MSITGVLHGIPAPALAGVPVRISGCADMLRRVDEWCRRTSTDGLPPDVVAALDTGRDWLSERAAAELEPEQPHAVLSNGDGSAVGSWTSRTPA